MPSNNSVKAALSLIETDKSKVLGLTVGKHINVSPGSYIPRADAQSHPELSFTSLSSEGTYILVGLDIDAPFPSFGVLGPILHWIQPDLKATPVDGASSSFSLSSTAPFVANYIGPAPPPGSSPHRYIFFLYEQPADFDGKKYAPPNGQNLSNMHRMRYDLDAWAKEINLGPVLATNYFKSN
ncbi:putative protease inhibitor [Whalleya microplaca]|nr:putative protease inhibitor [Whalleya microplaca]